MSSNPKMSGEMLKLEYIPLERVVLWDENPKKHDIEKLINSIGKYGFGDPPKYDSQLNGGNGGLVYGNGRSQCVQLMRDRFPGKVPRGILADDGGTWYLPVLFGLDSESEAVAKAFAIDHNNLTMLGGDFGPYDTAKMWNSAEYLKMVEELTAGGNVLASITDHELSVFLQSMKVPITGMEFDESLTSKFVPTATFTLTIHAEQADEFELALDEFLSGREGVIKSKRG